MIQVEKLKVKMGFSEVGSHAKRYLFDKFNQICNYFGSHWVPICLHHFYLPPCSLFTSSTFPFSHCFNTVQWSHFVASPLCNSARRHLFPRPKWNSINFVSPNCFLHHFKFITYIYFELVCFLLFSCTRRLFLSFFYFISHVDTIRP